MEAKHRCGSDILLREMEELNLRTSTCIFLYRGKGEFIGSFGSVHRINPPGALD